MLNVHYFVVDESDSPCQIVDIFSGGPCHNTKLERGDILTHIDGNHLHGRSDSEIINFTMGDEGSTASLTVKRGATSSNNFFFFVFV